MSAALAAMGPLFAMLFSLWVVSVVLRDSSLIDLFWGPAFGVIAVATAWRSPAPRTGVIILIAIVLVWGARLGGYLAWRNLGKGEDPRYRAMRARSGHSWWWRSLFVVFGLQGVLAWIVALPITLAIAHGGAAPLAWLAPGLALFLVGLFFEAVADLQLARFKADPTNRGRVLETGLWRYTRHPNYFGNFCIVWSFFAVSVPLGAPLWTALGPALMTFLLLRVSGVALLERSLVETKPDYAQYVRRTSAFFPRPRRG